MQELKAPIQLAELRTLERLAWLPPARLEILGRHMRAVHVSKDEVLTEVCGLPWEIFTGLTETVLKPLFLVSLRRSLFLVEELHDRVALALWEYAGHPEAQRSRGLLPSTLTHEQVAAVVGASRPRVSLALKRLERDGVFVREGKRIRVHERPLRRYLERKYEFLL